MGGDADSGSRELTPPMQRFDVTARIGMAAPKGAAADVVDKLNGEINKILNDPELRQHIIKIGIDPIGDTPQAFGKYRRRRFRSGGNGPSMQDSRSNEPPARLTEGR